MYLLCNMYIEQTGHRVILGDLFFFSMLFRGQIAVPTFTLELSACQMLDDAIKPIKCVLEIRTAATIKFNLIMFQHFLWQKMLAFNFESSKPFSILSKP